MENLTLSQFRFEIATVTMGVLIPAQFVAIALVMGMTGIPVLGVDLVYPVDMAGSEGHLKPFRVCNIFCIRG